MVPVALTALPTLTQLEPFQRCSCTEKLSPEEKSLSVDKSKRMPFPAATASVALVKIDAPEEALSVNSILSLSLTTVPELSPALPQLLALHTPLLLEKSFSICDWPY
ncbi:hypothetical protein D3C80_1814280 [compost metagenome]